MGSHEPMSKRLKLYNSCDTWRMPTHAADVLNCESSETPSHDFRCSEQDAAKAATAGKLDVNIFRSMGEHVQYLDSVYPVQEWWNLFENAAYIYKARNLLAQEMASV